METLLAEHEPTIDQIESLIARMKLVDRAKTRALNNAIRLGRPTDIIQIIEFNSELSVIEEWHFIFDIDHRTYMQNRFSGSLSESKQDNIGHDTVRAEALVWAYQQRLQLSEAGEKDSRMQRARDVIGRAVGVSGDAIEKSVARLRKKSVVLLHYDPLIARFTRPQLAAVLDGLPRARGAPRNSDKSSPFRSVLE